jgi:hypothetical protein
MGVTSVAFRVGAERHNEPRFDDCRITVCAPPDSLLAYNLGVTLKIPRCRVYISPSFICFPYTIRPLAYVNITTTLPLRILTMRTISTNTYILARANCYDRIDILPHNPYLGHISCLAVSTL